MLSTPKSRGELFLASSLRDGLEDNDIRQVETLLSVKDADPNVLIPSHGISPFHLVIGNESEQFAERVSKLFLRHGGDPNVRSVDGMTPVHVAAAWGRVGVLELLLANGGDPLCLDDEARSPFHYAFDGQYYDAVATLGKYCGASHSDEEEEPKYKLTFDKMYVNKGNVIAEYVPASGNASAKSESTEDYDREGRDEEEYSWTKKKTPSSAKRNVASWQSENVTVRRYKKRQSPSKADVEPCARSVEDEKLLVGQIIRRLSSTLSSDSVTDDTTIIRRDIKNARTRNSGLGRRGQPRDFPPAIERHELVESRMTPCRKLGSDTSIISKSPNCRISTLNDKTPKSKVASSSSASVRKKNADDQTPPRKLTRPPEVRARSASSTPKKNRYGGRLYDASTIERNKNEKLRPPFANDRRRIAPKISDRIVREREKKIVEYSPDAAMRKKPGGKYGVRNIAIRLDERMYDENPEKDYDFEPTRDDDETREPRARDTKVEPEQHLGNIAFTNDRETRNAKLSDNENDEEKNYGAFFESPRSSVTQGKNSSLNCTAEDEEAKILLEIEEAFEKRCGTPPASVSMLDVDENLEKKITISHSDYSSGESSSFCEFHEADPGTMSLWSRAESLLSVDEEYTYEDREEGIAFTERHLRVIPSSLYEDMAGAREDNSWIDRLGDLSLGASEYSAPLSPSPSVIARSAALYDDALLRDRLTALGEVPGPITKTTFNVYLKRLWRLERGRRDKHDAASESPRQASTMKARACPRDCHVPEYLLTIDWTEREAYYRNLEEEAFKEYSVANPRRKYRGGVSKTSFCYLLLDPRVTRDLPRCGVRLTPEERWRTFLEAVFYVGKGKAARPAAHLYDAFGIWRKSGGIADGASRKIRRILDIWQAGHGVVCLHVFSHTMTEEACSREASIIEALGTLHLTNCVHGTYYGYATTMCSEEKRSLGKYLLYKSMEILMHEGERQLFPRNVAL